MRALQEGRRELYKINNHLNFNTCSKCRHITEENKIVLYPSLMLDNQQLDKVDTFKHIASVVEPSYVWCMWITLKLFFFYSISFIRSYNYYI